MDNRILPHVRAGDEIVADDWNAIVEALNADQGGKMPSRRRTFVGVNTSGVAAPAMGVATLTTSVSTVPTPVVNFEQAGSGIPVAIWVNTPAGGKTSVHTLDRWAPTRVICSDASVVAGDMVGPVSGSFAVGKSGNGLIAITSESAGTVWVVVATGGGNCVALTTDVIPARDNLTPGGPITVTKQKLSGGVFVSDGAVEIYSWVNSPSKDPADMTDPDDSLFIFIEQDNHGTWWWTGEDCDPVVSDPIQEVPTGGDMTGDSLTYIITG